MKIFFIVYKPRSGSTLLANLLSQHKNVHITPESRFIPRILNYTGGLNTIIKSEKEAKKLILDVLYTERKFRYWGLEKKVLLKCITERLPVTTAQVIRRIVCVYCSNISGNVDAVGVKKGYWYLRNIDTLREIFPDPRFVHIIRDGRAVYASSKKALHSQTKMPLELSAFKSAKEWRETINISAQQSARSTGDIIEIKYENIIHKPVDSISNIFSHIGLELSEYEIGCLVRNSSVEYDYYDPDENKHGNVGRPLQESRIDAWRSELSTVDIKTFESIASEELSNMNYPIIYGKASVFSKILSRIKEYAVFIYSRLARKLSQ